MTLTKERNVSIDILKILSMAMVIILHTKTYGLMGVNFEPTDGLYWIIWTMHFLSLVAVNCFVLISGYFTSVSESAFSLKKPLKLWLQVEICSVGIYLILCAVPNNGIDFGFGQFLVQLLPIMSNQYWFFTCFFVLMIISPFLNRFINTMEQKELKRCILIILSLFVLVPSLNIFDDSFDTSNGYSLAWFVVLYLVAAYLRRYPLPKKPYGIFYLAVTVFSVLSYTLLDKLNDFLPLFGQVKTILVRYNSATVFVSSVCLFLFFLQHPIKPKRFIGKFISGISAVSFTVYLIHEHPAIRDVLWGDTIKLYETTNNIPSFLLRVFLSVIVIFVVGALLGKIFSAIINTGEKLIYKIKQSVN